MHLGCRSSFRAGHQSLKRRHMSVVLALACATSVALGIAGCASSSRGGTSANASSDVITAEEIARVDVQNAYEAVQKLRPAMFRPRQPATANAQAKGEVLVYVDNNRFGNADALRLISASSIELVRYYSASEAQTKWGSGHPGGVIEVLTRH